MTDQHSYFAPIIKDRGLTAITDLRAAWTMLDHLDPDSMTIQVSQSEIATVLGCDTRAVRRSIKRLVQQGHFQVVQQSPTAPTVYAPATQGAPLPPQPEAMRTTPPPPQTAGGDNTAPGGGTPEAPQHLPEDQEPSPTYRDGAAPQIADEPPGTLRKPPPAKDFSPPDIPSVTPSVTPADLPPDQPPGPPAEPGAAALGGTDSPGHVRLGKDLPSYEDAKRRLDAVERTMDALMAELNVQAEGQDERGVEGGGGG